MSESIPLGKTFEKSEHKRKNTCKNCNKRFSSASKLRSHEISHSDKKDFQCNLCNKLFKSKSSLQRHQRHNHENERKYKCIKCKASFSQRINLHIHQERLHNRPTNFKCPECDCFFKRLNELNRHQKSCHTQKLGNLTNSDFGDDPNSLAELIVTQLKSLEESISSIQKLHSVTTAAIEEPEITQETAFAEQAKFNETFLSVKLNPERTCKTIMVQTVKRPNDRLAYVCKYCAKEFHKTYNLIRHQRTHTKEKFYGCTTCSSNFITKTQLEMHIKRMHVLDEKTGFLTHQHKCYVCFLNFSSMRKLDQHMKSHTKSHHVQYYCSICQRKFSSKTAFSTHRHDTEDKELAELEDLLPEPIALKVAVKALKLQSLDKVFTCSICSLQLRTRKDLNRHRNQHQNNKKFKCTICGSSYISNLSLRSHQKLHNKETCFPCTICSSRKFPTLSQLERHKRHVHQEVRDFQCHYCSQRFKTVTHCKSHMKTHLKKLLGPPQQCALEQSYSTTAQLIVQERNASSNSAKFIQIELLPKHPKFKHRNIQVEVATNLSPEKSKSKKHNCSRCDKQFQKPSDLLRHFRLHTQERPYNCDKCEKSFKLKSTLDDHQITHLNSVERSKTNVTCQVCGKSYASKKSLTVHLRLHTGKFPFQCETCGKSFRTSGHRLAHLKSKNGNCVNRSNILVKY